MAIFGLTLHAGHAEVKSEEIYSILKSMYRTCSAKLRTENKFPQASGVAFVRSKEIFVHKNEVIPEEYAESDDFKAVLKVGTEKDLGDDKLLHVLCNARVAHFGNTANNLNNQPIVVDKNIVGVLSGKISKHEDIINKIRTKQKDIQRKISVVGESDSEAFFQQLNYHVFAKLPISNYVFPNYLSKFRKSCEQSHGSIASSTVFAKNPYLLFLHRTTAPLYIYSFGEPGITIFCSYEEAIDFATQGRDWDAVEIIDLDRFCGIIFNAHNNTFKKIEIVPDLKDEKEMYMT